MSTAAVITIGKRQAGRPRRITLESVVAAGCEIGLDKLEMGLVAQKLGVGVATLYRYVDDRDHLVRLVADTISRRCLVEDHDQSWADALREHADTTWATYRSWPQLIGHLMDGALGSPANSEYANALLRILLDRHIEPVDAMRLYYETNQLVIGAAVGAAYHDRLTENVGGAEQLARQLRAECELQDYDALRLCSDSAAMASLIGDYRPALERLIAEQQTKMPG